MPTTPDYRGIIPAIACPFTADRRGGGAGSVSPLAARRRITGQDIQVCGGSSLSR